MKQYIGTKTINAKPMNRLDYNTFRGWTLPEDENGADDGYLVEYVDGGKANTESYSGYVSWSPKDVFENAYKISDTYQDRLCIESDELSIKIDKLADYIAAVRSKETEEPLGFNIHVKQLGIMQQYLEILGQR